MQTDSGPFPTDDETLERLEHACRTSVEVVDGEDALVGGDFTLGDLLSNMSKDAGGYAVEAEPGVIFTYSETDVILALIARIRELEQALPGERELREVSPGVWAP